MRFHQSKAYSVKKWSVLLWVLEHRVRFSLQISSRPANQSANSTFVCLYPICREIINIM